MEVCVVQGLTAGMSPGQILRAVTQALVLLLPKEAQLALGLFFLCEVPSQTWASLTVTAFTNAVSWKRQHSEGSLCVGCLHSFGEV